jgi:hypothetical protein
MNLLRLFEFYLFAMFFIGTVRRAGLYRSIVRLSVGLVRRYQKLLDVVREEGRLLLTWSAGLPLALTLVLWAMQASLTRLVFPHAELLTAELMGRWWFLPALILPVLGMLLVDGYFLIRIGDIDVAQAEKYFGQAESWLGTWKAAAVKAVTLGYVDPQRIVQSKVKMALTTGNELIRTLLWWTVVQTGMRVAVGIALWIIWAVGPRV